MVIYKRLEEVCDILDSQRIPITASERTKGIYPYYGANGIQDYVDDYIFDDELVLLAEDGGNFGSTGKPIAYRVSGKCWVNNHAHVLKAKNIIDTDYLCLALMFYNTDGLVNGATRQKLTQKAMRSMIIPVRSCEDQQRIKLIIQKVFSLIESHKKQIEKLDELIKSRFVEMFGDPEINPRSINIYPWKEIFYTQTGKLDSNEAVINGKYPFFTCSKEPLTINEYAYDCEALLLAGNNAAGIYDVKHYNGKFNAYQRTYILQLQNKEWEYAVFKHQLEDKLLFLQSQSKGTNTRYLTMGILNQLSFLVPPIKLQNQFADFVNKVEKQKATVQQSIDKLETLKESLMQEYFG